MGVYPEALPGTELSRRSLLKRERSLDTRRKLVRAAARLWSEKGYDTTTVEEICSAAGVGRTTPAQLPLLPGWHATSWD